MSAKTPIEALADSDKEIEEVSQALKLRLKHTDIDKATSKHEHKHKHEHKQKFDHHDYPQVESQDLQFSVRGVRMGPRDVPRYGFTNKDLVRIDTGTEYIKLPLSTCVKVRLQVDRIQFTIVPNQFVHSTMTS